MIAGSAFASRRRYLASWVLLGALLLVVGCAKYNTFYNAKRAFDDAEEVREDLIKEHKDPGKPTGGQATNYELAARKAQKMLDNYPGHSLTDDALFLQGKSYHRLESYRMSIRKFDNLFLNYPATPYLEEALYLQALNYLLIGAVDRSQDFLHKLEKQFPESDYQAETLKVSGDNAFTLERWADAADYYQNYLDDFPQDPERDRIGLKLAECYWELKDYDRAAVVLQEVSNITESSELAFRARLWRARVHVRMGDYEIAELLAGELEAEAEFYESQGQVQLIKAENLVAQGKGDEASPLLENMPEDWAKDTLVTARSAEILGNLYLERGMLEEAKEKFTQSLRGKDVLDDENRCRVLKETLDDYLAAELALPDAPPERIPRLKLLQANSLLFGFERPGEAARLYAEAAADTSADSTTTPRALFGAVLTYRDHLDKPDSAAYFAERLVAEFPSSPQAYEIETGNEGDLLGFLLAQRQRKQADAYAALTDEELEELNTFTDVSDIKATLTVKKAGVRRRTVFLARRDNIVVPPSADLLAAAEARRQTTAGGVPTLPTLPEGRRDLTGESPVSRMSVAGPDSLALPPGAGADSTQVTPAAVTSPREKAPEKEAPGGKPEEKKKKKKTNKFDLR